MITTPDVITRYYQAAGAGDLDALLACFSPDAVVVDEGQTHTGPAEIRAWREALASKFTYTTEITGTEQDGDCYLVATHIEGDFPGGVADLSQRIQVVSGLITGLTIT